MTDDTKVKYIILVITLLLATSVTGVAVSSTDSDGDGFSDDEEAFIGTDPNDSDTDDDGIVDSAEAIVGTDPLIFDTITDDDYASDYDLDNDADGLSNGYELTDGVLGDVQVGNFTGEGGNPNNPDTDEDGLGDRFEVTYAGECVDVTIDNSDHDDVLDPDEDCDSDTLTNTQEETFGTSPLAADSDSDGYSDFAEVAAGSDPIDVDSTPDSVIDHGAVISVHGKTKGRIKITYSDYFTLTFNAFTNANKPKVRLSTDGQRIVAVNKVGRKLKVFDTSGNMVTHTKLRHHAQAIVKLKVWDFYQDGADEIVVVTKRKQALRITVITLTNLSSLSNSTTESYDSFTVAAFKLKKHKHHILIQHHGNTLLEYNVKTNK